MLLFTVHLATCQACYAAWVAGHRFTDSVASYYPASLAHFYSDSMQMARRLRSMAIQVKFLIRRWFISSGSLVPPTRNKEKFGWPVARPRIGPPGANHGPFTTMVLLQPSLAAAMCTAPCGWPHPAPPVPPFLLTQNLRASTQRLSFLHSVQYDVIKGVLHGLKGFKDRTYQEWCLFAKIGFVQTFR